MTTTRTSTPAPHLTTVPLDVSGSFSLESVAMMGFGHRHETAFDGVMRLAFCLDGGFATAGAAEVRQAGGAVECAVVAGDPDAVTRQVSRVLSLDHDGAAYDVICERDPLLSRLASLRPGLRPPLFYSPYEAAAWGVLSARRSAMQMTRVRTALSRAHGTTFELAGQEVSAFPTPLQLLGVSAFDGIEPAKIGRLHGIARAALDGALEATHLRSVGPDQAALELQRLPGIGPFYASLVVIRAVGFTDVLATAEPRLLAAVGDRIGLGRPATAEELTEIAESWRPFRTWANVLIRATANESIALTPAAPGN